MVDPGRPPHDNIAPCANTRWIPKATDKHSQYIILTVFPRQQWLRERAPTLRRTYIGSISYWSSECSSGKLGASQRYRSITDWQTKQNVHLALATSAQRRSTRQLYLVNLLQGKNKNFIEGTEQTAYLQQAERHE